mmetsp:Transcript_17948/g.50217  ORF Transcript_17948/g.50217 Transcript_17948/m.50217 type:complete len:177 (+) Transcript_17948:2960-3490(+)
MAPLLDVLMTLLHLGSHGWRQLLADREELYQYAKGKLSEAAAAFGERVLDSPGNPISIAVSLSSIANSASSVTFLGSMLWSRCVSGTRVISPGKTQAVGGHSFQGYGSSYDAYPVPYLTAAAAIGTSKFEVDEFCLRLGKCVKEFRSKQGGSQELIDGGVSTAADSPAENGNAPST